MKIKKTSIQGFISPSRGLFYPVYEEKKMILPVFGFVQCIHVMLCYICFVVLPEVPGPRPGGGVVSRLA